MIELSRKFFYNGIADCALLFAGIVSSVVLTRLLGPDRWGQYSQMTWLINFSAMLAGFGLTYTSMRFIANLSGANDKANLKLLVKWMLIAQLLLALLSSVLVFLFSDRLIALTGWQVNSSLVRVTSFGIFSYTLLQLGNAMLRGLQGSTSKNGG
jgi:O-antigen/teichoic acid export membrane protein